MRVSNSKVIKVGEHEGQQYLLMEWFDKGSLQKNIWENFGAGLATLHKHTQKYFGLEEDNYIGSLQQSNTQHDSWSSFYSECRILPLVRELFNAGDYSAKDVDAASSFCNSIQDIFPIESPSLLHGDLWAGNYLITSSGKAAIFDPAVYFGHREMDIGMTKLFGGFDVRFYQSYNEVFPLENNWQKRIQFTQLYPLLVHAVLFGGHYISSTKKIFDAFK